ncbi:peptide chain release factor N(5)-glutamine methyltransferase [Amphibacillus sp. MSJ-3]|uniref:peptide chain release factor N(5)-glutamine methyltransferase n=1 Tax=Amphibacillus sp. MSJ-3 TaxID=2841505 RepID=UPI001C0F2EB7|nr:peptide chain release factor N(5)-glutamine methyltransferase [Amphibacillus sp. MSJ-3]MBU5594852.1 peptide chain release factor N(5)-glutamine methyltransferase [Amphibacillus sp. MSJ-3]
MDKTIQEVLNGASLFLKRSNREQKVAEILLLHHTGFSKTELLMNLRTPIDQATLAKFQADLKIHAETGKPVQHLTGVEYFYGREFTVNKDVLIPRPETEELVQLILKRTKDLPRPLNIIDIGTGSGVIPITLKLEDPSLTIEASDISDQALTIARYNAEKWQADIEFHQSDFLQKWLGSDKRFDLIVSNPPYIAWGEQDLLSDTVKNFDPELALFADNDGLAAYQQIIQEAKSLLVTGGYLAFEIGYQQGLAVSELIQTAFPQCRVEIIKDINKKDRIVFAKC